MKQNLDIFRDMGIGFPPSGKKWASGVDQTDGNYKIDILDLAFTPSLIVAEWNFGGSQRSVYYSGPMDNYRYSSTGLSAIPGWSNIGVGTFTFTSGSAFGIGTTINWIAFE